MSFHQLQKEGGNSRKNLEKQRGCEEQGRKLRKRAEAGTGGGETDSGKFLELVWPHSRMEKVKDQGQLSLCYALMKHSLLPKPLLIFSQSLLTQLSFVNFKMKIVAQELYCPFGSTQNRQKEMEKIINEKDQWKIHQT